MSLWLKVFGDPNEKYLKKIQPVIEQINGLEKAVSQYSDEQMKVKTEEFKQRINQGESQDELLPEAFALVREATKRTLNKRHFDVQLIGGVVLHRGQIAEMKTGEGKTQTAVLATYLNALDGQGVHMITVNDYLAKRDAVWMGQIFSYLGLSVACLQHEGAFLLKNIKNDGKDDVAGVRVEKDWLEAVPRKEAYMADVLYGTNSEFGFDYLRDNMVVRAEDMVQRPLHFAIIDEVDSILIDEARTPLIISAPAAESSEKYYQFAQLVRGLQENVHYNVDEKMMTATLTEAGIDKLEKDLGVDNIYADQGLSTVHHIEQALRANTLYKKDKHYVVKEGEVIIVDEFTGRLMQGRRYGEGLHQAVEAKEGVPVQQESQTMATITIQNYFRLYKKLAGMTGTAATEAEEFSKIYKLEVTVIPTNKSLARKDLPDRIYSTEMGKFKAIVKEIKELQKKGQPVLVGTISIEKNELLGEMLSKEGVSFNLLNAKNHEREAEIIAQAGRPGAVTIATNMAGRGVDIILGGNPSVSEDAEKVRSVGGLLVLGTERHESRRIDNQLRGRAGRQGDVGATQFYLSLEDDLMRIFGPMTKMKAMMKKLGVPEDMPIENKVVSRSIEAAQKKVEGHNFDIRKHVVEYDDVINKHREVIYKKRKDILYQVSENPLFVKERVLEMLENELEQVVSFHTSAENRDTWDIKEIVEVANTIFPIPDNLKDYIISIEKEHGPDRELDATIRTKIIEYLLGLAKKAYIQMENDLTEITDNPLAMREVEKGILLRSIDSLWVEHLTAMDYLRTGIRLRGYAQKDPLVEYKKESYRMFNELVNLIQKQVVYSIFKVGMASDLGVSVLGKPQKQLKMSSAKDSGQPAQPVVSAAKDESGKKVGRNDPCPCGSGSKYKRCCGA